MVRFFNVDSLSKKYAYQSHYNFSENRVVDGRELEGLEAKLINENTIEWRVKVDNKLGYDYSKTLLKDAADILSQNGMKYNIINDPEAKFTLELSRPTMRIDPVTKEPVVTNGYTMNDGNTYDGKAVSKDNPRTLAHELGHKASLPHIFDEKSKLTNTEENKNNLMNSGDNNKKELRSSNGTELVPAQTNDMKSHIQKVYENKTKEKEIESKNNIPNDIN
ncbi:hypothetical protein JI747_018810 [Chryseobacterium sp. RG1]|uniref:Uncharacterized protein n=1 Tax=Chryseobacterium tagetis TaxID=2801334 RepID=A0ABS8A5V5_9FLAO|nr:hypothetical protein [Chryseobacterium tagetis]MCA6069222.1 hypothetical protein [Chryseobacterium tagetis]